MAITSPSTRQIRCAKTRGFALFIAVVFMSVMLMFGMVLGSIGYKQYIIAVSSSESQDAFYAADAALECALYADQQLNLFKYVNPQPSPKDVPAMECDGTAATATVLEHKNNNPKHWNLTQRTSINGGALCADVTIYKPEPFPGQRTYIFSVGYNLPCAQVDNPGPARLVARGLSTDYE